MDAVARFLVVFSDNLLTGCLAVMAMAVAVPATFIAIFAL